MIRRRYPSKALHAIALGLPSIPVLASAQLESAPAEKDWRKADDEVGRFKRGHADILKWEAQNTPAPQSQEEATPSLSLMTAEDAVRQAWKAHRELVWSMGKVGTANVT